MMFSLHIAMVVVFPLAATAKPQYTAGALDSSTIYVYSGNLSWTMQLAVKSCVGLMNRKSPPISPAYLLRDLNPEGTDLTWLALTENISNPTLTPTTSFLATCLEHASSSRYIIYNAQTQQKLVPIITTLAGVMGAVPFHIGDPLPPNAKILAFDASEIFQGFEPVDATRYAFERYINETTGLSKLNPGYETQKGKHILNPKIVRAPDTDLTDYIVYAKLFNIYLVQGCLPLSKEHALFKEIAENNPWPKPIAVMGYDSTFVIGGDLFEAETLCDVNVAMGQVASGGSADLSYFSLKSKVVEPLPHNPDVAVTFNSSKTYIAFLIGDGDNIDFITGSRRQWITERVARCAKNVGSRCTYPLLWTMSPKVLSLAGPLARWFTTQLLRTGLDRFALPPSGDLYSYPSMFPPDQQATFVRNTEADAQLLATRVSTAWEFAGHWEKALASYFPRFAERGLVDALVTVNVPYMVPAPAFGKDMFKVLGGSKKAVVFKPHEWRGTRGGDAQNLNVTAMAHEINSYAPGTVTAIYITSDGGGNLGMIDQLVNMLSERVQVVGNEIGGYAVESIKQRN